MSKNKVKLLLVEDYIELNKISLVCDRLKHTIFNLKEKELLEKVISLKNNLFEVYEKVFFRFGLMDVSYLLLKEGLNNQQSSHVLNISQIEELLFKLKMMVKTLSFKLKKLSLNEIEMKYVIQNLSM